MLLGLFIVQGDLNAPGGAHFGGRTDVSWSPSRLSTSPESVFDPDFHHLHGPTYSGGLQISGKEVASLVKIGRGVWPEVAALAPSKKTGMGSAHGWMVMETWDHRYFEYSLQGGP
jgi:hypothetical protein